MTPPFVSAVKVIGYAWVPFPVNTTSKSCQTPLANFMVSPATNFLTVCLYASGDLTKYSSAFTKEVVPNTSTVNKLIN